MFADEIMKTLKFAHKLDIIRRSQGITIASLSTKSGVPQETLERIIEGRNAPKSAHLIRIVRALNINIDVFSPEDFEEEGL